MLKKFLVFVFMLSISAQSLAQCAMCRTTLENNVSAGNPGIGAGINFGILYLFFSPYVAAAVIIYFWYRSSRKNGVKFANRSLAR